MCGICGRYAFAPMSPSLAMWDIMIESMWRRGPDDRGIVSDKRCVLANCRLVVMDPTDLGHLPMRSADGQTWLAYNGELYGFAVLRNELEQRGHRFTSPGDSQVLLYALREWGVAALDRLDGMFALAYYDSRDQTLLLARDHAGIKPLYVLEDGKGIVFASEYDQIAVHPWARGRRVDPESVAMYLRLGYIPAPRAYLRGTAMLPPGSWLRARPDGTISRGRWFQFAPGTRLSPGRQEIAETIRAAVVAQSVSDAPLGSLLSGGIDSPLIAANLAQVQSNPVQTFSVAMTDPALDETADIRRYTAAIGSRHTTATMTCDEVLIQLDEAFDAMHEPLADEGILPSLLVSRLARADVTVVLSGEGGDELFWGYTQRQLDLLDAPPAALGAAGALYFARFCDFEADQFAACFPGTDWWPEGDQGFTFPAGSRAELADDLRRCEFEMYLPFILLKADRASMHHSLEIRVPLLSRSVIAMSEGLRWEECVDLSAGLGKLPLRRALRALTGLTTPGKRGFTAPMDALIRGILREHITESIDSLNGLGVLDVDAAAIRRIFDQHLRGERASGMALWRILCLDRWARRLAGMSTPKAREVWAR